jgi:hypothetical protein
MGEHQLKQSATQKFLQKYPFCCLCGGATPATTREHVPPKALFDRSHRPDRLVVPACRVCNNVTSTGDLLVSLIARWEFEELSGIQSSDHAKLAAQLRRQAPDVLCEWLSAGAIERKRVRRTFESRGMALPNQAYSKLSSKTWPHLHLFAHKLTLGLYFERTKRCLSSPGAARAWVRLKEAVALEGIPQEVLHLVGSPTPLVQGQWTTAGQFEWREAYNKEEGVYLHVSKLRAGSFIVGVVVEDIKSLGELDTSEWVQPGALSDILKMERLKKYF